MRSEDVVVQAPMSYRGSAGRLWRPVRHASSAGAKVALGALMAALVAVVWVLVTAWYCVFGLLVVPYRLVRRGQRRRRREELRYRELADRA